MNNLEPNPPRDIVRRAEIVAARQPPGRCSKSLRGAVIYDRETGVIHGTGYNRPPEPMGCTGTARCRSICRHICEHAESRAIDATMMSIASLTERKLQLVHVKLGADGKVTPSGPPSCAQCSRRILGVGFIAGVWLFELCGHSSCTTCAGTAWRYYPAIDFHRRSLAASGLEEKEYV